MGAAGTVIGRAARRVCLSSAGEVAGRAINLLLPFALFAVHRADGATDRFFLTVAVAFFVYGTLANALVGALVPQLVNNAGVRNVRGVLAWAVIGGGLAGGAAAAVMTGPLSLMVVAVVALSAALMATAGIASAPAVAALNVDHRYALPGLTWCLRIVPVILYLVWRPSLPALHWLLAGLALADAARAAILLALVKGRLSMERTDIALEIPPSALHLLLAAVISGLSPLIARWIASFGDAGSVSLFEAADRLYAALAALATIGVGNVTLVYLARLAGTEQESRGWRHILWASVAWSALWLVVSLIMWAGMPLVAGWFQLQSDAAIREVRDAFLALAAGIPGFIMTGMLGRRLLTAGLSRSMVPMAVAVTGCSGVAGGLLFPVFGIAGIALGLSLGQYLAVILMTRKLMLQHAHAHIGPV